jgi:hypothetical protein
MSPGRHRSRRRHVLRRAGLAAIVTGTTAIVVTASTGAPAGATAPAGSEFGSLDLNASAAAVRAPLYSSGGEDVEAEVPWSSSTMQSGGVGRAITSVFWPGDTGGHGGDTLYLLAGQCVPGNPNGLLPVQPPCVAQVPTLPGSTYDQLNDPYKAEAKTGSGQPTVTNGGQGVAMTATATGTQVSAATIVAGSALPALGDVFGATAASTRVLMTGPHRAAIDAVSTVHDLSLAGGLVTIATLKSVAHAVTDGTVASGTASTTVTGMTVAGTPVTIDDTGVHAAGQGSALPNLDAINQLLAPTGMQMFLARPTRTVSGASVTLDAGNLIIMLGNAQYKAQGNDTGRLLVLGGASIAAGSSLGFPYLPIPAGAVPAPPAAPVGTSLPAAGAAAPPTASAPAPQLAAPTQTGQSPVLAAVSTPLPGGIPAGWVVLVALGTAVLGAGLRRLPDTVLNGPGTACPVGDDR